MPDQIGPQLALVIPTYRWNALAKDTLTQAAAFSDRDILVHIGDNSANPEKHAFLHDLAARNANVVVTCHATNLGADPNWLHLIKAQSAPFICMAADDDAFAGSYFRAAIELLREDPHCSTASGLHVSIAHSTGGKAPVIHTPAERRESEPLARIRRYRGQNSICYAVSRRPLVRAFADFVEGNPLPCPFYDYMLAFHLLSVGTYRIDQRGFGYLYDHTGWQLNDAFIESNKRWYRGYGLPDGFGYLTRLHWAVVAAHFFSSTFRSPELPVDRAASIAGYLFNRQRREFARDFYRYKGAIDDLFAKDDEAAAACLRLMTHAYDRLAAIFDDFARVVSAFKPASAAAYRAFQDATLHAGAEAISLSPLASLTSLSLARATAGAALRRRVG